MKREFYNQHSEVLGENMSMLVYGEGGYPVIAFQAQDAKSNNFEDFGMIDVLAPFIDDGRIQVFSVDNLDEESWSDEGGDPAARAARQEDYFRFVTDELIPRVHAWNNSDRRPIAVGCSMGATHAAIAALRRPDLFQGCIALSGVYSTSFFFGDWMDENLYNNDVPAFLANMPADHPYVDLYNQRQLVMCVGQGAWEMGIDDLHFIDNQLNRLGVTHWCDFWGYDVNHDWPWWRKQMPYFMDEVLRDIESQAAAEVVEAPAPEAAPVAVEPAAEPVVAEPAEKVEEPVKKAPAKRTTTRKAATTKTTAAKKTTTRRTTTKKAAAEPVAEVKAEETVAAEPAAETEAPAKKAPAKRTTTRKAATTKTTAAKKTTTRRTTTKKAAAEVKAEETVAAEPAAETEAPAKKAPAKRTTTRRRTTKKADTAENAE